MQALTKIEFLLNDCMVKLRALRKRLEGEADEQSLQAQIILAQISQDLLKAMQKLQAFENNFLTGGKKRGP
jgi:hypothetical protein